LSSITDIGLATSLVASQLGDLSGSVLSDAQSNILSSWSSSSGPVSSAGVVNAAILVLSVVSASAAISQVVQESALFALSSMLMARTGGAAPLSPAAGAALLNTMGALTGGGNSSRPPLSAAGVEAAAVVMFEVARSAHLSDGSVTASVLSILSCVAGGEQTLNGSASSNIVSALSSVVAVAGSGSTLNDVSGILDSLARGQAAALAAAYVPGAPLPPPFTASSPTIYASVQVLFPSAGAALAIALVPGSPSAFQPIPAAALADAGGAVRRLSQYSSRQPIMVRFHSLIFDPYGGNATTGSTRLELSTLAGAVLEVANTTAPIRLSLPSVPHIPAGSQAVCSFWDTPTLAYSTSGCIALPSPQPPGHIVAFMPGFSTPSDTSLMSAWSITGPLVSRGCQQVVLDCGSDSDCDGPGEWGKRCTVFLDPRNPTNSPAITCPSSGAPVVMRIFYGASCALVNPANALNCSWSNTHQSFQGDGCTIAPGATQCMCRHLTDFASSHRVALPVCSVTQLAALEPSDLYTRLKLLLDIIVSMFVLMHIGGACAALYENQQRKYITRLVCSPAMGFEETFSGSWTWRLEQAPLTKAVDAPSGAQSIICMRRRADSPCQAPP